MSDTTGEPGTTAGHNTAAAAGHDTAPGRDVHAERGDVHAERGADSALGTSPTSGTTADAHPRADARTTAGLGTAAAPAPAPSATTTSKAPSAAARPLLPPTDSDRLGERLHHALAGFVDAPRASVEEADRVLEEITARFTEAVTQRRRSLRASWQEPGEGGGAPSTDTEQLRLALRDYREMADRLMRL
ncbi:hypothetical protein ACFU2J_04640 [Streptomyces sp. NPDC057387]|uniref:hypothetical protein n=1 Tax=Streptomyces sp. NPDC057387 TaxID=3346115 RepID=UPI0013DA8825